MIPPETARRSVTISVVTKHSDGTESFAAHHVSPINEAACEGVFRSLVACLLQAPVDEGSAPSGFVSTASPVTKIECSLQVFEDPPVVAEAFDFFDSEFLLGYD